MTPAWHAPWPASRTEALRRLARVDLTRYAQTRNHLDGEHSLLSPYVTHGWLTLPEMLAQPASSASEPLPLRHPWVLQLGWRSYFLHVWRHLGERLLHDQHAGPRPAQAMSHTLPADFLAAHTGVPVIDRTLHQLHQTGHLHNHARLWLASYLVHVRGVHWRVGADWLHAHLLDGDVASNHLSWQWVAGTRSHQPYLFNADNVARHAPAAWHSPGTVIDQPYEVMGALARGAQALPLPPSQRGHSLVPDMVPGLVPDMVPDLEWPQATHEPGSEDAWVRPQGPEPLMASLREQLRGQDVLLLHPWNLGMAPREGERLLAWSAPEWHALLPWSPRRWQWVAQGMSHQGPPACWGSLALLQQVLGQARSVRTRAHPLVGEQLPACVRLEEAPALFCEPGHEMPSFSKWWQAVTHGLGRIDELPGLAHPFQAQPLCGDRHDLTRIPDLDPGHRRHRWHRP